MTEVLSSDKPITTQADDVLGYWPFASAVAKGLIASPREGFVLGVQAAWGMGKTSAVNLIVNAIGDLEASRKTGEVTIVARFNPWMFSSVESLAAGYLNQIGAVIAEVLHESALRKSGKLLKQIAKGGSELLGGAAALGVIAATGGAAAPLASSIKSGVSGAFVLATHLSDRKKLDDLALELRSKLSTLPRRIIIVLDDLDRLQPAELRQILTLVKTFGDLPNVIHLLVYDRTILSGMLDGVRKTEGPEAPSYLEKIVQAEYDLPRPTREGLSKLLSARLDHVFGDVDEDDNWSEIWNLAFDLYLKSPRDISRFGNALSVTWPSVAREVYPPDLIAIELFRIFNRPLYKLIADNKDALVGLRSIWRESDRQRLAGSIKHAAGEKDEVLALVRRMFPRLEKELPGGFSPGSSPRGHRRGRIIGSEEGFDSFFRFEPSPLQISVSTVTALHEQIDDAEFVAALLGDESTVPASAVLDEIVEIVNEVDNASTKTLQGILRGASRAYIEDADVPRSFLGTDNRQRLSILINQLLKKTPIEELRADLPELVGDDQADVSALGLLIAKLGVPYGAVYEGQDSSIEAILDEKTFRSLAQSLASRVEELSKAGRLLSKGELWVLLKIWSRFGKKGQAKRWLKSQLGESATAAAVIFSSMNITSHNGRTISRKIDRIPDPTMYDVDALMASAEDLLRNETCTGQAREDLDTFVRSISSLRAGVTPEGF